MRTFYNKEEADFATRFVGLMPATSNGKLLQLLPWQKDAISEFYGTQTVDEEGDTIRAYQYLYLELTKKQGKTELAAALGVLHLLDRAELNAEVYLVAGDRENAGICYDAVVYKLENTPAFARMIAKGEIQIRPSTRMIRYKATGAKLRVLSADADTKHGYKPSCVIFDELHAQPNRKLWDIMTYGAGDARLQPVWIVLTTAGDDPDRRSIGWEIHQKALGVRKARELRRAIDECRDPASLPFMQPADPDAFDKSVSDTLAGDDPLWLPVMFGLNAKFYDDEDAIAAADIYDETLWRELNPSIGTTVKLSTIRAEARAAKQNEAQERLFRWLRLNQWIATKTVGWIPLTIYDKTQWNGDIRQLSGKKCYGGLDLSSTNDMTGFVLFFPAQDGLDKSVALPWGWIPGSDMEARERRDHANYRDWQRARFIDICDGDVIDYEAVKDKISDAARLYDLRMLGTDPYLSRTITQDLMNPPEGKGRKPVANIVEIPQTIAGMWPAMWQMQKDIGQHEMLHVHNTAARYCFGNIRCHSDGNGNLKPMKNLSRGRIDMSIAWINAVAAWLLDGGDTRTLSDAINQGWTL